MNPEQHSNFESMNGDSQEPSRHNRAESRPEAALLDQLTPAEQEEKDKALQEATAALAGIWEMLSQRDGKPAEAEMTAAIDSTPLREIKPVYKSRLKTVIAAENPNRQSEHEFVDRGLKVLSLWIHLQGLKRGTLRDVEKLRAGLGSM